MSHVAAVSSPGFKATVLQSPVPVLVDFYADWCGPCRSLAPTLERLAAEFAGRLRVVKVNIDTAPALADMYRVSSIPTLVAFSQGTEIGRATGLVPEQALRESLAALVQPTRQAV